MKTSFEESDILEVLSLPTVRCWREEAEREMKCQREGKERKERERGEEEASPSLVDSKSPRAEMRAKTKRYLRCNKVVLRRIYRNERELNANAISSVEERRER